VPTNKVTDRFLLCEAADLRAVGIRLRAIVRLPRADFCVAAFERFELELLVATRRFLHVNETTVYSPLSTDIWDRLKKLSCSISGPTSWSSPLWNLPLQYQQRVSLPHY
jgi:hypothetical protein